MVVRPASAMRVPVAAPRAAEASAARDAPSTASPPADPADVFVTRTTPGQVQRVIGAEPLQIDALLSRFAVAAAANVVRDDRTMTPQELVDRARRLDRSTDLPFAVKDVDDVMRATGIPSESALLRVATDDIDTDGHLTRGDLLRAALLLSAVPPRGDVDAIQQRFRRLAAPLVEVPVGSEMVMIARFPSTSTTRCRVLVTAGVHGDEPGGPAAALWFAEKLAREPDSVLRRDIDWTIVPFVVPESARRGTRRLESDEDPNRLFGAPDPRSALVPIEDLLRGESFDVVLDLHSGGAGRDGFWVYPKGEPEVVADSMADFGGRHPLLSAGSIEGMTAPGIAASPNPPTSTGATLKDFAQACGAPLAATLEAPGSVGYLDQALGLSDMVQAFARHALASSIRSS